MILADCPRSQPQVSTPWYGSCRADRTRFHFRTETIRKCSSSSFWSLGTEFVVSPSGISRCSRPSDAYARRISVLPHYAQPAALKCWRNSSNTIQFIREYESFAMDQGYRVTKVLSPGSDGSFRMESHMGRDLVTIHVVILL